MYNKKAKIDQTLILTPSFYFPTTEFFHNFLLFLKQHHTLSHSKVPNNSSSKKLLCLLLFHTDFCLWSSPLKLQLRFFAQVSSLQCLPVPPKRASCKLWYLFLTCLLQHGLFSVMGLQRNVNQTTEGRNHERLLTTRYEAQRKRNLVCL